MVQGWLAKFEAALAANDAEAAADLFAPGGLWRDLLAFTWNILTCEGRPQITAMLSECLANVAPRSFRVTHMDGANAAWIAFETATATCIGRVEVGEGRANVLFTAMEDLIGHEEARGPNRPKGVTHKADRVRATWSEARADWAARIGHDIQPHTLIIGGGQGGLALAARLKSFGVPALVVEKNSRAGDSWRNRYRSLVLHDPVWYDHLPYLPFPETWPVFCPKDKMGDWLEAYASIFELDLWTETVCTSAIRDDAAGNWAVTVQKGGEEITLTPREVVFCTGAYGPPNMPEFAGRAKFAGQLIHSSAYREGTAFSGKRAVVIGGGSSAHDVAVDLWEAGAEVTMLQRSPSTVVRSETLMKHGFKPYSEEALARGEDHHLADTRGAATPYALFTEGQKRLYQTIRAEDAGFYDALEAAGFALDFGEDDSGLMMKALRTASGYYIDVGASQLIIDGAIGVVACDPIDQLVAGGIKLSSGRVLEADVIIACTGYQSMNEALAPIISRAAADAVGPCWGLGSGVRGDPEPWQGELRNMWKPTALEGLWFHGGNLALSRYYSRFVALQLKARAVGIPTPVYGRPAPQSGL